MVSIDEVTKDVKLHLAITRFMPYSVRMNKSVIDNMIDEHDRAVARKLDRSALNVMGIPVIEDDSIDGWKIVTEREW